MSSEQAQPVEHIDIQMVYHIAHLARLGVTEAQAASFSQQLTTILDYFNHLAEVEVEGVTPATSLDASRQTLRPDEVLPSLAREEFLAIVPRREGDQVRVASAFATQDEDEA
jgi:aspartyl-tRNA(Asn)/glutamyl-tRNA(Gln) amidotransferase subunit C